MKRKDTLLSYLTDNYKTIISLSIICFAIRYFLNNPVLMIKPYDKCEESKQIYSLGFKGIVKGKIFPDGMLKRDICLMIRQTTPDTLVKMCLSGDKNRLKNQVSFLFSTVSKGDSVWKTSDSFSVMYKRKNEKDWNFTRVSYPLCQ